MAAFPTTTARPELSQASPGGLFRGWDAFWFTPADPATLSLMRVFCGLVVFYVHLTYSWGLLGYVGPDAWLNQSVADYIQKELPVYALPWNWTDGPAEIAQGSWYWSVFYHVHSPGWIVAFHVLFLVAPLMFAAGLLTRVFGVITWIGAMSYCQRAANTVFGLDTMMMIALAYLNLGPCGARYSLDSWLARRRAARRGEPAPEVAPSYAANFAIRLTQIHFCVIYLATGTSKLLGATWWAGTSLNLVLLNSAFAPLDQAPYYQLMKWLAGSRLVWEVAMTATIVYTLALEIAFPFLVWNVRLRWLMICCSVLLHTGIGLCMGLVSFSLMMMVMVLSFVPPETVRSILGWLASVGTALVAPNPTAAVEKPRKLVLTR
ncbi:MAG: hypothetical protein U0797_11015 [Gemmataceae bacterium]